MIINHNLKIIFFKTKKTAGTSFEIALSKFCNEGDVITPISSNDERLRIKLGFKGAQNYKNISLSNEGLRFHGQYYNHISSKLIKSIVPKRIWNNYNKMTIYRNPFDVAISRYYWEGGEKTGLNYLEYLKKFPHHLTENIRIAPLSGDAVCDLYLKYEDIKEDLKKNGLNMIWSEFRKINAKSDKRPKIGASICEIYKKFPKAIDIINEICAEEINYFNYPQPNINKK